MSCQRRVAWRDTTPRPTDGLPFVNAAPSDGFGVTAKLCLAVIVLPVLIVILAAVTA